MCILFQRVLKRVFHLTRMNGSCHKCEGVMSHVWMSRVTKVDRPCHMNIYIYTYIHVYIYIYI